VVGWVPGIRDDACTAFHEKALNVKRCRVVWPREKDTVRRASIRTLSGPFEVRCMLGVQPGAAIYPSVSRVSQTAHSDLRFERSHPDWAVDV